MSALHTNGPITELSALDDLFASNGVAVVKVTRRHPQTGEVEEHLLEIPIQSVDIEEVGKVVGRQPKIPRVATGGNPKFVEDQQNPAYLEELQNYNRRYVMALACMGLAIDIKDKRGEVVWSADNTIRNFDAAQEALKAMGLVYSQVFAITRAINELTTVAEEAASSD